MKDRSDEGYAPRFNVPLWDRCIPEGDPLSIECHVDSKPPAIIVWFKDGGYFIGLLFPSITDSVESNFAEVQPENQRECLAGLELEEKENLEIRNSTDGACRLRITKFSMEETGGYKCFAKNMYGSAETRANYNVEGQPFADRSLSCLRFT